MKKILVLIAVTTFSSCKKKYNCSCSTTFFSQNGITSYVSDTHPTGKKLSKKQAQALCADEAQNIDATYKNLYTNNGSWTPGSTTYKTNCLLK